MVMLIIAYIDSSVPLPVSNGKRTLTKIVQPLFCVSDSFNGPWLTPSPLRQDYEWMTGYLMEWVTKVTQWYEQQWQAYWWHLYEPTKRQHRRSFCMMRKWSAEFNEYRVLLHNLDLDLDCYLKIIHKNNLKKSLAKKSLRCWKKKRLKKEYPSSDIMVIGKIVWA